MPWLPDSRKEAPLFFFRKCFFHSLVITVSPPHRWPLHPSTRGVPAPSPDVGQSRSRIVIEPPSVPSAKPNGHPP